MVLETLPHEDDSPPEPTDGPPPAVRVVVPERPPWPGPAAFVPPRPSLWVRLRRAAGWLAPALLTAALTSWNLDRPALWADELATVGAARLPWPDLLALLNNVDAVIGPYYALMHGWTAVAGDSTVALRLPSLVAVVAATLVVTALGRRTGGPAVGVVAGLLFAVLPATSRYGQEARAYGLVMLAAALAVLLLVRVFERPSVPRLTGYAVAVALVGVLHPLGGLLTVAAHAVAAAWLGRRNGWRTTLRWCAAVGLGLVPVVMLAIVAVDQRAQVSWITLIGWQALVDVPQTVFASAAAGAVVLVLAAAGGSRTPAGVCLTAAAFVPTVLLGVAGQFDAVWVARYLVVTVPAVAVLAAAAAARVDARRAGLVVLLVAALAIPDQVKIRDRAGHGQDSARIAEIIGPNYLPGDVLVVPDTNPSIPWAPRDIVDRYLPPAVRPPDVLLTAAPRTGGRFLASECPEATCLGSPPRVWLVRVNNPSNPLSDMSPGKQSVLTRDYAVRQRWSYPLLTVLLLERRHLPTGMAGPVSDPD